MKWCEFYVAILFPFLQFLAMFCERRQRILN